MVAGTENAANLLRALRREQGRSLRTAAADIGLAPSHLSRIERGQRSVGSEVSQRLATYYGVSAEVVELASGEVPEDVVRILQAHPTLIERLRAEYGVEDDVPDPHG
jgi:transcriptional regulator with XRE-family HTH domain